MSINRIHNNVELKNRRKQLRNNLTPVEAYLWRYLQSSKLDGRKFRRQHSVNKYVLDFYCPSEKLAVELDGYMHFYEETIEYDKERSEYLNKLNIKVIRFEN